MKKLYTILLLIACINVQSQQNTPWKGKKCAVVLTYDDALNVHLDNAIPLLDSLALKATFYLSAYFPGCSKRLNEWRKVATNGHELANHTLFHPCIGDQPGREFVRPDNNMNRYTVKRMVDEIRMTNVFLEALDGKKKRTFAFTCGDMKIGDTSFMDQLKNDLVAARTVYPSMPTIDKVDVYQLPCYSVNGQTGEALIEIVKEAIQKNGLLVFLFHGVGGEHSLNVSLDAHRQLLNYLKQQEKDVWVTTALDAAEQVNQFQSAASRRDSINRLTQTDYRQMLSQLKITSTRPGPSGNPNAPNAANIDESKASPYTSLPDPLVLNNGKKVNDSKAWFNKRRPEIVELFDREIYGRMPANTPKVNWEVTSTTNEMNGAFAVITKKLVGHVNNSVYPSIKVDIQLTLTTPANAKGPVPVIMEFGFIFPPGFNPPRDTSRNVPPSWQQQLLAKGWGYAVIVPTSYQADNGAGLTQGIIGLVNKGQPRKSDDWGALRAWAWGASRAIDYFETDKAVDAKRIGIEGLSRYGKAALVTMAYEPRIAIGFIGSSGAGGAKILRRIYGEQVENLAASGEYHWFAGNFIRYAGPLTPNDLPVDAHELVALCAPRPVYISSGSPMVEGRWVDAKGMFLGGAYAGPVYRLLGKKDLGATEMPEQETGLLNGDIAFRMHAGGHTTGPNWPSFIEFAARYFNH